MLLIIPLLALFLLVGLTRRTFRALDVGVLAAGIVLISLVYFVTWSP